ncbi:MAG TPA: hypothetical protein VNM48_03950 [Chloroflexota bacterium]|nr:hypothetical protein [Chloroflexota bacterium]
MNRTVEVSHTLSVAVSDDCQEDRSIALGKGVTAHAWDSAAAVEVDLSVFQTLLGKRREEVINQWDELCDALGSVVDQMAFLRGYAHEMQGLLALEGCEPITLDMPSSIRWLDDPGESDAQEPAQEAPPVPLLSPPTEAVREERPAQRLPVPPAAGAEALPVSPQTGRPQKYTEAQREAIRAEYATGTISTYQLATKYGIPVTTVQTFCKPKPNAKKSQTEVVAMREQYAKGDVSTAALGREHGVPQAAASGIVRGDTWKDTTGPIAAPRFPLPKVEGVSCVDCGRVPGTPVIREGQARCARCHEKWSDERRRAALSSSQDTPSALSQPAATPHA